MPARTVVLLAYEGCQVLHVSWPAEGFSVASAMDEGAYRSVIASFDGHDVVPSSGVRLGVDAALPELDTPIDTLVVPGGFTWPQAMEHEALLAARRRAVPRGVHAAAGRPPPGGAE
jgi:transcriptional regulator GlxA family with amidase domain